MRIASRLASRLMVGLACTVMSASVAADVITFSSPSFGTQLLLRMPFIPDQAIVDSYVETSVSRTDYVSTTLPGFDSSLGTLQGVSLEFASFWRVRNQFSVYDPEWVSGICDNIFVECDVGGRGYTFQALTLRLFADGKFAGSEGTLNLASAACGGDELGQCSASDESVGRFDGFLQLIPARFPDFVDTGPLQLQMQMTTTVGIDLCGDDDDPCTSRGRPDPQTPHSLWALLGWRVQYTYDPTVQPPPTPTPEPSALGLLAIGLVGLALRRRR